MLTKKELDDWLEFIRQTLFDVNIAYSNMIRISTPKNTYENIVVQDGFFHHMYSLSRFTIIIQLSKLFAASDNQKRNINKLLNRLKSEKYDNSFNALLSKNKDDSDAKYLFKSRDEIISVVESIQEDIKNSKDQINNLITLRDKYYAHSDPKAISDLPKISNKELKGLIDLAINIYEKIWGKLMNITYLFDSNGSWTIDHLIESQAFHKKNVMDNYQKRLAQDQTQQ